jgi:hypothetical protein
MCAGWTSREKSRGQWGVYEGVESLKRNSLLVPILPNRPNNWWTRLRAGIVGSRAQPMVEQCPTRSTSIFHLQM